MKRKLYSMLKVNILVFLFILYLSQTILAQKFTLAIIPDPQCEVNTRPEMFMSQMQYIVDKKDSLNIPYVLAVGDMVDFNNGEHYIKVSDGFKLLDKAGIPYAITLGNHDTDAVGDHSGSAAPGNTNTNLRITGKVNHYFPVERFISQKGRFEENKIDNAFYTFMAGGLKWMVVTLEFCPRKEAVEWAGKIIAKNPKYNVIVLTHYFLNGRGLIGQDNAGYGNTSPQYIYDQVIKQYPNVRLVLSGHTGSSSHRDDVGVKGNHIYQILQDYQGDDKGGGYMRLLEIDPQAGTMSAKIYTPFYNRTRNDASKFEFTGVEFVGGKKRK